MADALPAWMTRRELMAYAETRRTHALVAEPSTTEECARAVEYCAKQGMTLNMRGSGYTYGDMILNDGHAVLDMKKMNRVLDWDPSSGLMRVEPGVVFADVFSLALPDLWTLPSCPGGMGVTIGGAISNNVHGKDSARMGNFGDRVVSMKLMRADGAVINIDRSANARLLNNIAGGMGLLGIIVEATLKLERIPSAFVETASVSTRDISETVDELEASRERDDFSVAWVDAFATGKSTGRGYVATARWVDERIPLDKARLAKSLTMPTLVFGLLPARLTWTLARPLFGHAGISMVNIAHYHKARVRAGAGGRLLFTDYNFMHNRIPDLKHVYRPHGFLEFQPMVPRALGATGLRDLLTLCQRHGAESLLCGVKSHRPDSYAFSYSGDGYSIGVDIQLRGRRREDIERFGRELFTYTADAGGRAFLAKDEMLPRDIFERMFPERAEFMAVKRELDPKGLFQSDMYRRLLA